MPRPPYASLPALLSARRAEISLLRVDAPPFSPQPLPAATTMRVPLPRVKRYTVPGAELPAEERIRAMVSEEERSGGAVLANASPQEQADAVLGLLREKGYL